MVVFPFQLLTSLGCAGFGRCLGIGRAPKMPLGSARAIRCSFAKEGRCPSVHLGNLVCNTDPLTSPAALIGSEPDYSCMQVPFARHASRAITSAQAGCARHVRTGPCFGGGAWSCISISRCSLSGYSLYISKSASLRSISSISAESFML